MKETLVFWLAIEGIGLAAFPLTFALFSGLRDRGYAFGKVVGLLLVSYVLWISATVGILPNSRGSIILILLVLAAVSTVIAGRRGQELRNFLSNGLEYILLVEGLFLLVFGFGVYLRSFAPDIIWGEKPFELAFLNSVNRAEFFPPPDPWLSGETISYYYFGYVQTAVLTKLSGLSTPTSFYLMLCLTAALVATCLFALLYNLASDRKADDAQETGGHTAVSSEASHRSFNATLFQSGPAVTGLLGVGILFFISNLAGVFELLARYGIGSRSFFAWVGISNLDGPYDCSAAPDDCREWYPTRFWWWWKATRMGSDFDIQEFPFFSFQFGDLHPHVMAIPLLLVMVAASFQLLRRYQNETFGWVWWLNHPWRYLSLSLLLGGLFVIDLWTLPAFLAVASLAALFANWLRRGRLGPDLIIDSVAFAVTVLFAAVLLYLPLYTNTGGGVSGIAVNQAWLANAGNFPPINSTVTRPVHYLIFWLPIIWLPLSFVLLYHWRTRGVAIRHWMVLLSIFPWASALFSWGFFILITEGVGRMGATPEGLLGEVDVRWDNFNWLTLLMLIVFLTLSMLALLREIGRPERERQLANILVFALASLGFLLVLGAELFFVFDRLEKRSNTVFRFWYQAWLFLAIASGYSLYQITRGWNPPRLSLGTVSRLAWSGFTLSLVGAAMVYTVLVTFERTNGFDNQYKGLNGLDFVRRNEPAEYAAVQWLNTNLSGAPAILEAQGKAYTDFGRISSRTGLPTVLGWPTHEYQWRGSYEQVGTRPQDIERIYTTRNIEEAARLLDKYGVDFVYVGRLEREAYVQMAPESIRRDRELALNKFADFMDIVFEQDGVRIYKVSRSYLALPLTK